MTEDPFKIKGPALISFSGGRTSAYMLWRIIQAHGGSLPQNVVVAFANTGFEREETLRFIHECGSRWGVKIEWIEFLTRKGPRPERYQRVGLNSASRDGLPMRTLIAEKQYTPNSMARFCTEELKVNAILHMIRNEFGWTEWANVIGLRHDEGHRVLRKLSQNDERERSKGSKRTPWVNAMPLADAKITKRDVMDFWASQDFDLGLKPWEGNCNLCFLLGREALKNRMRATPGISAPWIEMERVGKGRFVTEYSYADLQREVDEQPTLFDDVKPDAMTESECGAWVCEDAADAKHERVALQSLYEKVSP